MRLIELPFWLGGSELSKLTTGIKNWWQLAENWIKYPLTQFDELTCSIGILNLLAYQRDIERFEGEPEELYRTRVKYALINAQDAGSIEGFIKIFARLGLGEITLTERFDAIDWDVILINVSNQQIAGNEALLQEIIKLYGRTCRRYYYTVTTPFTVTTPCNFVSVDYRYSKASIVIPTQTSWDGGLTSWDGGLTIWR